MKPLIRYTLFMVLLSALGYISCKKDTPEPQNQAPLAKAGPDQIIVLPKNSTTLNGTASTDADGSIVKYQWNKIAGPASFTLSNATAASTEVGALVKGVYQFELVITDDRYATGKDTVQVTVSAESGENQAPVAHAGEDINLTLPNSSCSLNGSASYDPDGSIVSYLWSKVSGPSSYAFEDPMGARTDVNNLSEGVYRFELRVEDNIGLSDKDTVEVRVVQIPASNCDVSNRPRVNVGLTEIGTLSEARIPAVAAAGNKIVFAGGAGSPYSFMPISSAVDIYDINTHMWTRAQLSQARSCIAAVSSGNKIFFAGGIGLHGDVAYNNVDIYDVTTDRWSVAHLSTSRGAVAAAAVGNKVLFAGGTPNWWQGSERVDIYDMATNTWSTASLSDARMNIAAVTFEDRVYFAGGEDLGRAYKKVDIYDNTTGQWYTSNLETIMGTVRGAAVGNQIYWAGSLWNTSTSIGKVEIWLTETNGTISSCLSYDRHLPTVVTKGNNVLIFGWDYLNQKLNQFDIYNPITNAWSIGLTDQPIGGAAVISVNNTVYIAGSVVSESSYRNKVYTLNLN